MGESLTLVVTTSWPRTGDEIAGTFVRADALVRARSGARVIVIAPTGPGRARGGVPVIEVPHAGLFGSPGAAHNVRLHRTGLKHMRHPVVGELHLSYDVMQLPADPGLSVIAFSAQAGSPDDDALRLLASWAATHDPADALATPNQA